MYFNLNFKRIREKWGTQEDVAIMLGSTRNKIKSYEDQTEPNLQFLYTIENLTGLTFRDLYERVISDDEIPDKPGEIITKQRELPISLAEEKVVSYGSLLIDDQALRDKIALLETRIERLEKQLKK